MALLPTFQDRAFAFQATTFVCTRYISFLVSTAQAMRAVLLAIAAETTFAGLRASSCVTYGYFSGCARARPKTANAPTTIETLAVRFRYVWMCVVLQWEGQ